MAYDAAKQNKVLNFLKECVAEKLTTQEMADRVLSVWNSLLIIFDYPLMCTGLDNKMQMSWRREKHYLEIDFVEDEPASIYYHNEITNEPWFVDPPDAAVRRTIEFLAPLFVKPVKLAERDELLTSNSYNNVAEMVADMCKDDPAFIELFTQHGEARKLVKQLMLARVKAGFTQKEFAAKLNWDEVKVVEIESGVDVHIKPEDAAAFFAACEDC